MKLSTKIFFLSSAIAAALLITRSGAAATGSGQGTTYVPPSGGGNTAGSGTSTSPASYPDHVQVIGQLGTDPTLWYQVLKPTTANGITQISSEALIMNAQGNINKAKLPAEIAAFQKVCTVKFSRHYDGGWNNLDYTAPYTDVLYACAFPVDVFKTADGWYIAVLRTVANVFYYGNLYKTPLKNKLYTPPAFVFYNPQKQWQGQIYFPDSHTTIEAFPAGSGNYQTSFNNYQCSI